MSRKIKKKRKFLTPFQRFVQIESFSGILLMIATVTAMIWANSPFGEYYHSLWQYKIGFTTENFKLNKPLLLWVNDGLMTVFFFLIGLEIKREILIGELNTIKKVSFPIYGAMGGMFVPLILFFILNKNPETSQAWGIPMATDIAFSLAILKMLGNKVPLSLKLFLTAFAIVDDIGAVLIIAIFYSGDLHESLLVYGIILLAIVYIITYFGYYSKYLVVIFGIAIWILFLKGGIHPTIAGILTAFAIPVRQKIHTSAYLERLETITENIKNAAISNDPVLSKEQIRHIDTLENWTDKFQSPLQHLEHKLHDWVAYFVIPIFALANAGVIINSDMHLDVPLIRNIIICLVFGNSIGISAIILMAKRMKIIALPSDLNNQHIIGVSFLAGIGFTMAIFVSGLAFNSQPMFIDSAKIGILIGSFVSAIIGYLILRFNRVKGIR